MKMKQDIQENETGFDLILFYHNQKQHSFKDDHKNSIAKNDFFENFADRITFISKKCLFGYL